MLDELVPAIIAGRRDRVRGWDHDGQTCPGWCGTDEGHLKKHMVGGSWIKWS